MLALAVIATMVGACASAGASAPAPEILKHRLPPDEIAKPSATPTPVPAPSPIAPLYAKLRIFVASESTDQVWVLDGKPGEQYAVIGKTSVGKRPHHHAVSPDGKWVAVNNRMGNTTSIIDPLSMREVVRLRGGKQPHGTTWSPDAKTLLVGHE